MTDSTTFDESKHRRDTAGRFSEIAGSEQTDTLTAPGMLPEIPPSAIARATAGEVQIVHQADPNTGAVNVAVLLRDREASKRQESDVWVEEGIVATADRADGNPDRISALAASQVTKLAEAVALSDDPHNTIEAFLETLSATEQVAARDLKSGDVIRFQNFTDSGQWVDVDREILDVETGIDLNYRKVTYLTYLDEGRRRVAKYASSSPIARVAPLAPAEANA